MKMCSFTRNMGLLPLIAIVSKINPTLWRFRANPLRTDWDIDENVQFTRNMGLLPLIAIVSKNYPTLWRFRANPLRTDWDIDENVQFY